MVVKTDSRPELDNVAMYAYINNGPFLDKLDPTHMYDNYLGVPYALEIHSSINGMYRYGHVIFDDRVGIRETLPLTGNEIISIKYKNMTRGNENGDQPCVIHFNIFDMEEAQINKDDDTRFTNKALKFHLIEAPFFLKYNQKVWRRSYGSNDGTQDLGMSIDKIFYNHLTSDLMIPSNLVKLNLQKMATKLHFCIPAWKSQKTFSYLLDYARDINNFGNVKFFTTSDITDGTVILNLQSMNQMFLNKDSTEFVLVDSSVYESGNPAALITTRNINQIISHRFLSYDISTVPSGFAGGQLINHDYINSRYFTQYDNYKQSIDKKENPFFYNFGLWSDTISDDESKQFYVGSLQSDVGSYYLDNKIIQHQYQLRCEVMTYVDETINVGDKITIYFLSGMSQTGDQAHLLDEQMSGDWLVEDMIDTVALGRGYRKMIVVKDSFFNLYDIAAKNGATNTLPAVTPVSNFRS